MVGHAVSGKHVCIQQTLHQYIHYKQQHHLPSRAGARVYFWVRMNRAQPRHKMRTFAPDLGQVLCPFLDTVQVFVQGIQQRPHEVVAVLLLVPVHMCKQASESKSFCRCTEGWGDHVAMCLVTVLESRDLYPPHQSSNQ